MNYSGWVTSITDLLEYPLVDASSATPTGVPAFDTLLPTTIDYVENRMQRDIDFISTTVTDATGTMTTNSRKVTLPTPGGRPFIVTTQIRPIVGGVGQQPLEPVTRDYLDFCWPSETSPGANILPVQWCENDQSSVYVGPAPDQAYPFEVVGTVRFVQLSATNVSNFLVQQLPELYVAASMVFLSSYQQAYGSGANDPGMAQWWEGQYQALLKSAVVEEARKNFANMFPSPSNPISPNSRSQGG